MFDYNMARFFISLAMFCTMFGATVVSALTEHYFAAWCFALLCFVFLVGTFAFCEGCVS